MLEEYLPDSGTLAFSAMPSLNMIDMAAKESHVWFSSGIILNRSDFFQRNFSSGTHFFPLMTLNRKANEQRTCCLREDMVVTCHYSEISVITKFQIPVSCQGPMRLHFK